MTDIVNTKTGWIFRNSTSAVYIIPEAIKEFNKNIKGDGNLEKHYYSLINSWLQSNLHPPRNICKKIKAVKEELYELKKSGTQVRLLGYYDESDFFVLKCIQKKENRIKGEDIQTLKNRRQKFNKEEINWED